MTIVEILSDDAPTTSAGTNANPQQGQITPARNLPPPPGLSGVDRAVHSRVFEADFGQITDKTQLANVPSLAQTLASKFEGKTISPSLLLLDPDRAPDAIEGIKRVYLGDKIQEDLMANNFEAFATALTKNESTDAIKALGLHYECGPQNGNNELFVYVTRLYIVSNSDAVAQGLLLEDVSHGNSKVKRALAVANEKVGQIRMGTTDSHFKFVRDDDVPYSVNIRTPVLICTNPEKINTVSVPRVANSLLSDEGHTTNITEAVLAKTVTKVEFNSTVVIAVEKRRHCFNAIDTPVTKFKDAIKDITSYDQLVIKLAVLYTELISVFDELVKAFYVKEGEDNKVELQYELPLMKSDLMTHPTHTSSTNNIATLFAVAAVEDIAYSLSNGGAYPKGSLRARLLSINNNAPLIEKAQEKLGLTVKFEIMELDTLNDELSAADGDGLTYSWDDTTTTGAAMLLCKAKGSNYKAYSYMLGLGHSELTSSKWVTRTLQRTAGGTKITDKADKSFEERIYGRLGDHKGKVSYQVAPAVKEHQVASLTQLFFSASLVLMEMVEGALSAPKSSHDNVLYKAGGSSQRPVMPLVLASNGSLMISWLEIILGRYVIDIESKVTTIGLPHPIIEKQADHLISSATMASMLTKPIRRALTKFIQGGHVKFPSLSSDIKDLFSEDLTTTQAKNLAKALYNGKEFEPVNTAMIHVVQKEVFSLTYSVLDLKDGEDWVNNDHFTAPIIRMATTIEDIKKLVDDLVKELDPTPQRVCEMVNDYDLSCQFYGLTESKNAAGDRIAVVPLASALPKPRNLLPEDLDREDYRDDVVDALIRHMENLDYLQHTGKESAGVLNCILSNLMQFRSETGVAQKKVWQINNVTNLLTTLAHASAYKVALISKTALGKTQEGRDQERALRQNQETGRVE